MRLLSCILDKRVFLTATSTTLETIPTIMGCSELHPQLVAPLPFMFLRPAIIRKYRVSSVPVEVKLVECVNSHLVEIDTEIKFAVNGSDDGFSFHERKMTTQSQADIQVFPAPKGNGSTWYFSCSRRVETRLKLHVPVTHRIGSSAESGLPTSSTSGQGNLSRISITRRKASAGSNFPMSRRCSFWKTLVESELQDTSGDRYLRIRYVLNEQGGYELGSECRKKTNWPIG